MSIIVVNHLSLDGVLQSPGRPDEDPRGGFRHGGWAQVDDDPSMGEVISQHLGQRFAWLFGRFSYEDMLSHWNRVGGPFRSGLIDADKYVVTSDPSYAPRWPNSHVVTGDVLGQLDALRRDRAGNLVVMGSGALIRTMLPAGLIDRLLLMVHPVVLGSGQRMFGPAENAQAFRLINASSTPTGVVVASYEARR
ncbi:dihydrofolate reductase family protein [Branchiibius cervicis]|uniref:Dihydrofolate reductase family protein n=1 Tax=Branchiibius cervicis TaxID=908252 RepID=A0ABW2AQL8_9MICO